MAIYVDFKNNPNRKPKPEGTKTIVYSCKEFWTEGIKDIVDDFIYDNQCCPKSSLDIAKFAGWLGFNLMITDFNEEDIAAIIKVKDGEKIIYIDEQLDKYYEEDYKEILSIVCFAIAICKVEEDRNNIRKNNPKYTERILNCFKNSRAKNWENLSVDSMEKIIKEELNKPFSIQMALPKNYKEEIKECDEKIFYFAKDLERRDPIHFWDNSESKE